MTSIKVLMLHRNIKQVLNLFWGWWGRQHSVIGGWHKPLFICLKIDDTFHNGSVLTTSSCVWADVFSVSHDGGRLTHRLEFVWQPLISLFSSFSFAPPLRWTFAYADPDPRWKSRTKSHEIRCQKLPFPWHTEKMWQTTVQGNENCLTSLHCWWAY